MSYRLLRLASRIKFLVSAVIQRELADPRLGFVTVLAVDLTPDIKEARIFVSVFGGTGDRIKTLHALEDARGFIQKEVGRNLETRNTPRLKFILDESQDKVSRIEALTKGAKEDPEEAMAKKSSKKEDKTKKEKESKKAQKKAPKPAKKGPARCGSSKGESAKEKERGEEKELKAAKASRPEHAPKSSKKAEEKKELEEGKKLEKPRPAGVIGGEDEKGFPDDFEAGQRAVPEVEEDFEEEEFPAEEEEYGDEEFEEEEEEEGEDEEYEEEEEEDEEEF